MALSDVLVETGLSIQQAAEGYSPDIQQRLVPILRAMNLTRMILDADPMGLITDNQLYLGETDGDLEHRVKLETNLEFDWNEAWEHLRDLSTDFQTEFRIRQDWQKTVSTGIEHFVFSFACQMAAVEFGMRWKGK